MRILIADDEQALVDGLVTILKRNSFSVDCCYNGKDALDLVLKNHYDVVILDIMMPYLDGYEVLRKMKERNVSSPVLFLSAKGETEDKVKGLDLGADDYLAKPFESMELIARIKALIRRSGSTGNDVLSFGETFLDLSTFSLRHKKKEVSLINKEFHIMELLMSKPHQVFSAERIMQLVWPYDSLADISTVWTFVSSLRRKLKSIDSDISIKSNRGLGYSLEKKDV